MTKSDDHFDEFEPHTLFKHRVLASYFDAWGRILLLRRDAGNCVVYVDACAGRGGDDAGNDGSPVLAARAAFDAARQVGAMRNNAVNVQVIAIEKRPAHHKELQKNLEPYSGHARALQGTLADHIDAINAEFPTSPKLYFIDPFGLEPLDGATVRRALDGSKNEVLVLFADMAAIRHFGAATSEETNAERALAELNETNSLFPEMIEDERRALEPKAAESREAQRRTRERGIEILDAVFQSHDWLGVIEPIPRARRREGFVELYKQFLVSCGAKYVLPFPVFDDGGQLKYHLVHASKSPRGYAEMKDAIAHAVRNGPLGEETSDKIIAAMASDLTVVVATIIARFAGEQRVRWAEDKKDKNAPSVKAFAMQATSAMPWDADELKRQLAVYRVPGTGNTILYAFPVAN